MATLVGSLFTSMTLENASFISNAKRTADATERMGRQIDKSLGLAKGAVTGFLGALSVAAVGSVIKNSLDLAGGLGELSQQAGVTQRTFQELSFAATQAGVKQGELEAGLARLTRTLGDAKTGGKAAVAAFAALGISQKQLASLNTDQALQLVANSLSRIEDPAKRAAAEVDLFGKAGQRLDPLLSGANGSLKAFADEAERLGIVLSDEQIANADKTADKIAALQRAFQIRIAGTVAENAVAIDKFISALARAANFLANNPKLVAFLSGAAVGGRFGGPLGALAGGTAGVLAQGALGEPGSQELLSRIKNIDAAQRGTKPGSPGFANFDNQRLTVAAQLQKALDREAAFSGGGGTAFADGGGDVFTPIVTKAKNTVQAVKDIYSGLSAADVRLGGLDTLNDVLGTDGGISVGLQNINLLTDDLVAGLGAVSVQAVNLPDFANILTAEDIARAERFSESLTSGLAQAIVFGQSLGDALVNAIKAAAAELIASQLLKLLTGGSGGGGGFLASIGSAIFGRASGGSVSGGEAYVVGERGREIFVPGQSGNIVPADALRRMGGGGQGVAVSVDVQPSPLFVTATRVAAAQGGQQAAQEIARRNNRIRIPGGRG